MFTLKIVGPVSTDKPTLQREFPPMSEILFYPLDPEAIISSRPEGLTHTRCPEAEAEKEPCCSDIGALEAGKLSMSPQKEGIGPLK